MAKRLEKHELLEFRRIAAHLYKRNKKFKLSLGLSKKDYLYKDAMETAAESKDPDIAQELLLFFIEADRKDCFAACLYTTYDLLAPDFVLELSWRHGLSDFTMPYLINVLRDNMATISLLEKANAERDVKDVAKEKQEASIMSGGMGLPLMIGAPQQQMGMGYPQQQQMGGGQYGGYQQY